MTLALAEAVDIVLRAAAPLAAEDVALDRAPPRVLAEPVLSRTELPPWDNAGMDGYAVRGADIRGATPDSPIALKVLETVRAGAFASREVGPGTAIRIMTGAPVPRGADSVVRVEDTDAGLDAVAVRGDRDAGRNVRPRGEDLRRGDEVLPAGAEIFPWASGALAAAGAATVRVHRRPRVAILGSGDELVGLDRIEEAIHGTRIIGSNGYALEALVRDAHADVVSSHIVPDDAGALAEAIERARGCDLLITTGGVSVGAFDFAREAFERAGGRIAFWRVRMRPGAQLGFGTLGSMCWLGLPGNPASAVVTFEVFARPLLRKMLGHTEPFARMVHVRPGEEVTTSGGATFFLRAALSWEDGSLVARLSGKQGSHVQSAIARANALLVVPEGVTRLAAGDSAVALPLGGHSWSASSPWRVADT